ncbi:serine hydrolase domain-containing protein [Cupriavidus sp. 2TAF22]|uniref:serine hydrolase domain-containing protein n=1 Tax=unclassified Cupriavidus TaxID=2640874 RepID=UPI003F8E4841
MIRSTLPVLAAAVLAACATPASMQNTQNATPLTTRFSAPQLDNMSARVRADVAQGRIPGAVYLLARNGNLVSTQAIGWQDAAARVPMREDAIFRIYSMSKPIVSVAVMMMVEDGRVQLADPVSKYLPELKGLQVGVEKTDAAGKPELGLVPAQREMTVQDLLRHTSGLTYGVFGKSLVKDEYKRAGVDATEQSNGEFIAHLAKVPLQFQPGTTWEYSRSTDVLGALLERVSGQTLAAHLQQRIFAPLQMKDTGFWVPAAQQGRIAEPFATDPDSKVAVSLIDIRRAPRLESGGGGLVSTAADYFRFAQMLLNGGELDGVRLLSPKTVANMTADHLGPIRLASQARGPAYLPGPGYGFGLGFGTRLSTGGPATAGSVGDFYWGGVGGTYFWVDPQEKTVAIWMMQAPGQREYYRAWFRNTVYAAMTP